MEPFHTAPSFHNVAFESLHMPTSSFCMSADSGGDCGYDLDLISRPASKIDCFSEDTCLHARSADVSDLAACGLVLTDFSNAY